MGTQFLLPLGWYKRYASHIGTQRSILGSVVLTLSLLMLTGPRCANAQVSGGTLSGSVTDQSGAPLPQAPVTINNVATGLTRTVNTNQDGLYSVPNLLPGTYEVSVSRPGFETYVQTGISLTVGAVRVVDISLKLGRVNEQVVVSSTAAAVQLADSNVSNVVGGTLVRDLPLNGRSWTDLATLQPGVASPQMQPAFNGGRGQRGFGNQIAITGSRPQENSYRLNGVNVNDYANGGPGNVEGGALGVDAIQEFSVLTGTYSAEYGRASGGVINAITRSGTNQFHGDVYEFLRNSDLDARNFFDQDRPPFRRNQFGASAGGPIIKNHTFIFGDYEGLRESKGRTLSDTVPTPAARAGQLSTGPVSVDPAAAAFLEAFYPLPNNGLIDNDVGIYAAQIKQLNTENFYTIRFDQVFNEKDTLNGSFMYDNTNLTNPDEFNTKLSSYVVGRNVATLEETHAFTPQVLNTIRGGFSRTPANIGGTTVAINPNAGNLAFGSIPGRNAAAVSIGGLTDFTGGLGAPSNYIYHYNSFQLYDDAFVVRGKHSLKFGTAIERIQDNTEAITDGNGAYSFASLGAFLTNQPTTFKGAIPSTLTERGIRQTLFGLYLQDDWRVLSNLTLNLGLRYEMSTIPTEVQGKLSILRNISDPNPHLGDPFFLRNPTLRNFEPRIGFAWDPFKTGTTSVRGGFGMFDSLPLPYQFNLEYVFSAPFFREGSATSLPPGTFPTGAFPLIASSSKTLRQNYADSNPRRNYVMQWDLNVQHEFQKNVVATLGYVGSRGIHQPFRAEDINMVLPTLTPQGYLWPTPIGSGTKINPNVGVIRGLFYNGDSYFHALEAQAIKRMGHGLQAQVSYTWSKNMDTGTAGVAGDTFANSIPSLLWFNSKLNRGLSDLNVSHNLIVSYSWTVPKTNWSGVGGWAVNGWELGGIFKATSGVPFTVAMSGDPLGQRSDHAFDVPNRLIGSGCDSLVNPGNVLSYIKTQCFSVPNPINLRGNAGRNILVGPPLWNLDFSVFKNNYVRRLSETFNAQFRLEVFNILNHPSFAPPLDNTLVFDPSGSPISGFGRIDSTATSERQIQVALKLIW
jgi:hypothetical protein